MRWQPESTTASDRRLVARGGFRDGQTAKARKGRRVQSLPVGRGHQSNVAHRYKEYPLVSENEMPQIL